MNNQSIIIKQIIGKTVKALRVKRDLSQEDLAGLCEVDRSYISMIEVGRNEPSVSKIFELCDGLKIKPSDFFRIVEIEYEKHPNTGSEND
ncbi:helix-turn-helix domain-containing protein [uncultured Brevibacillus sp.]|uniref:helix-turn-helix domain-containing protein n=1 Tax=uncultured Brevibacillus sp. TaxID=169970 RepID=UPI002598540D|nr:helix-turn-helix transcriptional regulator [uncultured Brevibacillus sp.]